MYWVVCFHLSIRFSMVLFGTGTAPSNVLSLHMVRKRLKLNWFYENIGGSNFEIQNRCVLGVLGVYKANDSR